MSRQFVLDTLLRWHLDARDGAVEWRDERRRRLFFFAQGALLLIQSNLKSESPTRIQELHPDADADTVRELVNRSRLRGAILETKGEIVEHDGAVPPERQPCALLPTLTTILDALPRPNPGAFPRVVPTARGAFDRLPTTRDLREWLRELDGHRTVEEVLAFAPGSPEEAQAALTLGVLVGALELVEQEAGLSRVIGGSGLSTNRLRPAETTRSLGPAAAAAGVRGEPLLLPPEGAGSDPESVASPAEAFGAGSPGLPAAAPPPQAPAPAPTPPAPRRESTRATREAARAARGGSSTAEIADLIGDVVGAPSDAHEVVLPRRGDTLESRLGPAYQRIVNAPDHFGVLGCTHEDPPEVLRSAYVQLARDLHPDRWSQADAAERKRAEDVFERVRAAWEVLGTEGTREVYVRRVIHGEKTEEEKAQERVQSIMEAEAAFRRGMIDFQAGRMLPAYELFSRAHGLVPEDQEMQAYHGFTQFRVYAGRDEEKARAGAKMVEAVLKANDRMDAAWVLIGLIFWAKGDEGKAKGAFVQALRIKPSNPDALRELKRLQRQGDPPSRAEPTTGSAPGSPGGFFSRLFGGGKKT